MLYNCTATYKAEGSCAILRKTDHWQCSSERTTVYCISNYFAL